MNKFEKWMTLLNSLNTVILSYVFLPLIPAIIITIPIFGLVSYIFAKDLLNKEKKKLSIDYSWKKTNARAKISHEETMKVSEIFNKEKPQENKIESAPKIQLRVVKLSPEVVAARAAERKRKLNQTLDETIAEIRRERENAKRNYAQRHSKKRIREAR